jgi:DNA-binding transcriptional LysR family regulator
MLASTVTGMELLRDIAIFAAVAKAKSFSQAAVALGMPVSSVSRRVSEMEQSLGLQLLKRSTRRVELTDAGAAYFEKCEAIVQAAESAHGELKAEVEKPRGHLRVSASSDFANVFLAPLFVDFARRYPDISFDFDLSPRWVDLVAERFDVAIRIGSLPDSTLTARRIADCETALFASDDYLHRHGRPARPSDLARHECIRVLRPHESRTVWTLTRGDEQAEVKVSGRFCANNISLILSFALRGLGIAAVDVTMAEAPLAEGRLRRVLELPAGADLRRHADAAPAGAHAALPRLPVRAPRHETEGEPRQAREQARQA